MDKVREEKVTKTRYTHQIYCDKCGKHIDDVIEHADGYYMDPAEYMQKCFIGDTWYILRMDLCDDCRDKKDKEIRDTLISLGFEEGFD